MMLKKHTISKIIICLIINLAIACLAIFVFGTHLYQDDDNILSWMTFGIITEASSRAFYTNVVLGWLYKHLFSFFPGFNWTTLTYYLGLIFSGTVGLYSVLKKNNKSLVFLWALFEVAYFNDVYVYLTYSVVAAFLACQGYLAMFLAVEEKEGKYTQFVLSGLVLVLSSMVRFDPFLSVSGFAFFAWVILLISEHRDKTELKLVLAKYVYPFVAVLGVCFAFFVLDRACYSRGDWKAYKEYENARSIITDENNCANRLEFAPLVDMGVTQTQALAVVNWQSNDPEILTTDLLKKIVSTKDEYSYPTSPYVWNAFFSQWKVIFSGFFEVYFSLILVIYLLYMVWNKRVLNNLVPLLLLIPFFGEIFYLAYIGRIDDGTYPARSVYVILMGISISAIILCANLNTRTEAKRSNVYFMWAILLASVIVVQPQKDYSINGLGLVDTDEICQEYNYFNNSDKIYVCEYAVRNEVENAFGAWQTPPAGFMKHAVVLGSWLINHPMQNKMQTSLGCENPYRALFEKENVYYIRLNYSEEPILEYLKENYDNRIYYEYIKQKGDFKVYKYKTE